MRNFAAYVFYVNRPDLLKRALESFPDLWDDLKIVDNSIEGIPVFDLNVPPERKEMDFPYQYRPPIPMTYSQSMNWMLADATKKNVDFIFHFHSDAVSSNPSAVTELLEYARKVMGEGRKWACLWTFYDILWVINPVAARDVGGWDTVFPSYFVDQDIRRRWNLAGWETIDTHIEGLSHEGSATINSDENLKFINGVTFPLYRAYYCRKWGGEPGHETYQTQFNR